MIAKYCLRERMIPKLVTLCRVLPAHMVLFGPLHVLHSYVGRWAGLVSGEEKIEQDLSAVN